MQIRIGDRTGVPMTGFMDSTGSVETGDWVSDGMIFVLVNDAAYEYGRAAARLNCGGTADSTPAAITSSTAYLPLQTGNQWVYRADSRAVTSTYFTRTVTGTRLIGDRTYFVLEDRASPGDASTQTLVREDEQGRIYRLNGDTEETWVDPSGGPGVVTIQSRDVPVSTPVGSLPVGLTYQLPGFIFETGVFARGLGQMSSSSSLISGSSGGFTYGFNLVESRIGSGLHFMTPATSVEVGVELNKLDVTGKNVTNCAIPCYFTACGLGGADPTGTYKPCFQARVRVGLGSCTASSPVTAALSLVDGTGAVVHSADIGLTVPAGTCQAAAYHQTPLYSAPNSPFPAGSYRVNVKVTAGGEEIGTASAPVTIQ
ncbi:MAG: hypothetical protein JSU00_02155 [Acidobacteria bacterium]|nr:hypothetical protein [Acidobacteriota bacterium]